MRAFYGALFGFACGVYADQNYHMPDMKHWVKKAFQQVDELERENRKKS
jgi:hypothetical protein